MFKRHLEAALQSALADTPIVLLLGARQTGKSTLVQQALKHGLLDQAVTCDDLTVLGAATADPQGFIAGCPKRVAIDEVQRAPNLLLPIKAAVDRQREPGRFLLTGSANVLTLPRVADTLAGRMEILILRPLSQGELQGQQETFIDKAFSKTDPGWSATPISREAVLERVVLGGFPEAVGRLGADRRRAWCASYVTSMITRDIRDLSQITAIADLSRLLTALMARTANLVNIADLGRELGIPASTLHRHVALLEATFLVHLLPSWSINITKRLVKSPKIMPVDTGLAAHLLHVDRLVPEQPYAGALLEAFVAGEVQKQAGWSTLHPALHHFRTHSGDEVDLILDTGSDVVGIEVKMAGSVGSQDLKGLRYLKDVAGTRFRRGIVLYTGDTIVPFAPDLVALPISSLWTP